MPEGLRVKNIDTHALESRSERRETPEGRVIKIQKKNAGKISEKRLRRPLSELENSGNLSRYKTMNGLELFTHATNTHGNTGEESKTAEEFLDSIRDGREGDLSDYERELEKALLYEAGFDVLEVEEAFE